MSETIDLINTKFHFAPAQYFSIKPFELTASVTLETDEESPGKMPKKQKDAYDAALEKSLLKWDTERTKFMSSIEDTTFALDKKVDEELDRLIKKKDPEAKEKIIAYIDGKSEELQKLVEKHVDAFVKDAEKTFATVVPEAIETSFKKMKARRKGAKKRFAVKVVLLGVVSCVVKAISKAVDKIPGSEIVTAPIGMLLDGIFSGLTSALKDTAVDLIKEGTMLTRTLAEQRREYERIQSAVEDLKEFQKMRTSKGSEGQTIDATKLREKIKAVSGEFSLAAGNLNKSTGQLDKYIAGCNEKILKLPKKITELKKAKASVKGNAKAEKQIEDKITKIEISLIRARELGDEMKKSQTDVRTVIDELKKLKTADGYISFSPKLEAILKTNKIYEQNIDVGLKDIAKGLKEAITS